MIDTYHQNIPTPSHPHRLVGGGIRFPLPHQLASRTTPPRAISSASRRGSPHHLSQGETLGIWVVSPAVCLTLFVRRGLLVFDSFSTLPRDQQYAATRERERRVFGRQPTPQPSKAGGLGALQGPLYFTLPCHVPLWP